jgi:hypothetical protein
VTGCWATGVLGSSIGLGRMADAPASCEIRAPAPCDAGNLLLHSMLFNKTQDVEGAECGDEVPLHAARSKGS